MACKCLASAEKNLLNKLIESHKELLIEDGEFTNRGFKLGGTDDGSGLYHEFKYSYRPLKKDGTYGVERRSTVSIYPTYCGFCGKPFDEEQNAKDLKEDAASEN